MLLGFTMAFFKKQLLGGARQGRFCFAHWPDTLWSVNVYQAAPLFSFAAGDNYTSVPGLGNVNDPFYAGLFAMLKPRFSIPPLLSAGPEIEVVSRCSRDAEYLFLLNLGSPVQVIQTPKSSWDVLDSQAAGPAMTLDPFGIPV